ncbi:hypothetical protein BHE74_00001197 [Ensete ventricosum]|nr:hypothetical protein GW17_00017997 [Ensete ventricosum]RWW89766.1 hypothetical protein BHE74_00001197 [Ensete ventricosum]
MAEARVRLMWAPIHKRQCIVASDVHKCHCITSQPITIWVEIWGAINGWQNKVAHFANRVPGRRFFSTVELEVVDPQGLSQPLDQSDLALRSTSINQTVELEFFG